MTKPNAEQLSGQNDEFRRTVCRGQLHPRYRGRVVVTAGVNELDVDVQRAILEQVARFDSFDEGNDPHGEHDFGAFEYDGDRLFWKIDYYDTNYEMGSDDPWDADITRRVLVVMLAEEY